MYSKVSLIVFYVLVFFSFSFETQFIHGEKVSISKKQEIQDWEFETQLKILNKKPSKTITTTYGDIVDCIDIYKQPAFDHPLLKNHKIQMVPSSIPEETTSKNISSSIFRVAKIDNGFQSERCPPGSVPIRRTKKEDLMNAQYLSQKTGSIHTNNYTLSPMNFHFVSVEEFSEGKTYFGGEAWMSVHEFELFELKYSSDQLSTAQIWVENGPTDNINSIEFGWMVSPGIYGDTHPHIFGYWTADGHKQTGCFNTLCAGFVQINQRVFIGATIDHTSKYGEEPWVMPFTVHRDPATGNWWLSALHETIGYWPKEIFTSLADNASTVRYGGIAGNKPEAPAPPMGNGYFPTLDDYKKTAFMMRMTNVDENGQLVKMNIDSIQTKTNVTRDLYEIYLAGDLEGEYDVTTAYGGPGAYLDKMKFLRNDNI